MTTTTPAHPRLARLVGDRDRGLRVALAGVALELLHARRLAIRRANSKFRRRNVHAPSLHLAVDATGTWAECSRCGLASWPVDTVDLGAAWLHHLGHCNPMTTTRRTPA